VRRDVVARHFVGVGQPGLQRHELLLCRSPRRLLRVQLLLQRRRDALERRGCLLGGSATAVLVHNASTQRVRGAQLHRRLLHGGVALPRQRHGQRLQLRDLAREVVGLHAHYLQVRGRRDAAADQPRPLVARSALHFLRVAELLLHRRQLQPHTHHEHPTRRD
jgi:hypothetical protein